MKLDEKTKKLNEEHTERLKQIISGLTEQTGLVDFYFEETDKLERKQEIFNVVDLDDTLFGRRDQMEAEPELVKRRWYEGNVYMINEIWIHNMIRNHYEWKPYPQDIISKVSHENTLLLTAWVPEYQHLKRRAMKLEDFHMKVVWEWKDKIMATIQYVLFELKYIPSEIVVYEDRPQYFIQYRELIEWVLWCELTIMRVEMDGNNWYKKIEVD